MHKKPGFILFLLFGILSVCSVLITLYFTQASNYRQLMTVLIEKQKTQHLAMSAVALAHSIITPQESKNNPQEKASAKTPDQKNEVPVEQTVLKQLAPFFNKQETYKLTQKSDGIDATLSISIQSEQGKLNINSLYDFDKKKFIDEGKPTDRKKLCIWMFEKIAALTKKPSLFPAFEKHLASRNFDFNDVTELLSIKEFETAFQSHIFVSFDATEKEQIFLTDLFTVCTEQETINPWLFSSSWCKILGLKPKQNMSDDEITKVFSKFKKTANWETDWNNSLKDLYQKEYKDLAQEIKTILTTQFEANIFSLLLKANINETSSTIFTIVKAKAKNNLISIEVMKAYQI
ncbi:MAG TPA: hypothetical protein VLG50_00530 [Candidatus Saccharimonadales bacterium]|nr:hypothetical protein [Candidatus Saccharimonadales bacterium]